MCFIVLSIYTEDRNLKGQRAYETAGQKEENNPDNIQRTQLTKIKPEFQVISKITSEAIIQVVSKIAVKGKKWIRWLGQFRLYIKLIRQTDDKLQSLGKGVMVDCL